MRLPVTSYPVADPGRRLARILTPGQSPGQALRNTFVYPVTQRLGMIQGNRADLLRLGALVRVAATSPRSAVYVPVPPDDGTDRSWSGLAPLALVVVREDAGLRPSDWPRLRERIRRGPAHGRSTTVTAPAPRDVWGSNPELDRLAERCPARLVEHAGTLFLIGRPELLFAAGDLITACGEDIAGNRHIHQHGEAWLGDLFGVVAAGHGTRPGPAGDIEVGVYAVEPIFHKRRWREPRGGTSRP